MTKFGIIIAIEEYSSAVIPKLCNIEFALNDAISIKKAFSEQLYIENDNMVFLTNEKATKAQIEREVSSLFKRFTPNDECYFYYTGHAFNTKSQNKITCWDTDNAILEETSLSLDEILLTPLRETECRKSFIFIDASAEELKSKNKLKNYSNNSKKMTSAQAKHGIWALHLINALNGKDDSAIDKNNAITNISLNKYLSAKIPQYITKTMFINDRQSPYGVINESQVSPLIQFESDDDDQNKNVEIQFHQYILSREQHIPFKNFEGFNKSRHKIPKDYSSFSSKLASELAQDEYLKIEIEQLFDNARKTLRLKNSNTVKDPEGGSLHTEFFRYNISAEQSENDFTEVTIRRELELRVPLANFPMPIDEIFTEGFDTITFPIKGSLDGDSLEDALYELEDDNQGTFEHKDNIFSFFPKNIKGIAKVEISKNTLKIKFASSQASVAEILDYTQQTLEVMAATLKNLLS